MLLWEGPILTMLSFLYVYSELGRKVVAVGRNYIDHAKFLYIVS